MNDNVGNNIKGLATVLGSIFIIGGIIAGLLLWYVTETFWIGLVTIASGVACFFSCWVLYGFGHLIEKVNDIENRLGRLQIGNVSTKKTNTSSFDDLPEL